MISVWVRPSVAGSPIAESEDKGRYRSMALIFWGHWSCGFFHAPEVKMVLKRLANCAAWAHLFSFLKCESACSVVRTSEGRPPTASIISYLEFVTGAAVFSFLLRCLLIEECQECLECATFLSRWCLERPCCSLALFLASENASKWCFWTCHCGYGMSVIGPEILEALWWYLSSHQDEDSMSFHQSFPICSLNLSGF